MLIETLHRIINFANDKGITGYHSPQEIDDEIHAAQLQLFKDWSERYAIDQRVHDYLKPFEIYPIPTVNLATGVGDWPDGIEHPTLITTDTDVAVEICDTGKWATKINDPVAVPSAEFPICRIAGKDTSDETFKVEVKPTTISSLKVYGLRAPKAPIWNYTIGAEGTLEFAETGGVIGDGNSVDLEWSELHWGTIRAKVLEIMGINLREVQNWQEAQVLQQKENK